MGRRGRPPKVKAIPRKLSESCSERESFSSLDIYLFQSSVLSEDLPESSSKQLFSLGPSIVKLNWVQILKGSTLQSGNNTISLPTVHLVSPNPPPVQNPIDSCTPTVRKIAKISKLDVEPEIKYWELSVVCYVTNANPPFMLQMVLFVENMEGFSY